MRLTPSAQFLTAETAKLHTMHEIVKHFNSTEQARAGRAAARGRLQ